MYISAWSLFFGAAGVIVTAGLFLMPFALLVVAGIIRQKRSPASSVAWMVSILMLPLIGLPLFWLFGNRKIQRIARDKPPVTSRPSSGRRQFPIPRPLWLLLILARKA